MKENNHYLNFDNITKECREFYKDFTIINDFKDENKKTFFLDKGKTISKLITLSNKEYQYMEEMQIYYGLMGLSFELLIKLCVLKYDWDKYVDEYQHSKNKNNFGYAKDKLLLDLKNKINEREYGRVKDILNFIHLQRNNFLHSPFKGTDHYAMTNEMLMCTALLSQIYDIQLTEEANKSIIENTRRYDYSNGMDFEDVGLYTYVEKLKI